MRKALKALSKIWEEVLISRTDKNAEKSHWNMMPACNLPVNSCDHKQINTRIHLNSTASWNIRAGFDNVRIKRIYFRFCVQNLWRRDQSGTFLIWIHSTIRLECGKHPLMQTYTQTTNCRGGLYILKLLRLRNILWRNLGIITININLLTLT